MNEIVLVYVPFASRSAAESTARAMVEQRLAACANLLGESTSIYPWDGAIETTSEAPVLFKTATDRRDELMVMLGQVHDYDVPAILAWNVVTTPSYAQWIWAETRPNPAT